MDREDIAEFEQLIQERKERKDWWFFKKNPY